ncbi:MAG: isoamylase early set domain-containing protein [Bacteroidales bacterium]|nr:isoamylase early set domain-containing protein [Bacteroidales bacterium]
MGRPRKNPVAEATEAKPKKETAAKRAAKTATDAPKAKRAYTKRSTKQAVKFELNNEQAQNAEFVSVAGEFNDWNKDATPMSKTLNGFEAEIELEKGKSYQFRYVLNGTTWINDPYRKTVDNGMGENNSVIEL